MKTVMLYDGHCILCMQTQQLVKWCDWLGRVERLDAQNQTVVFQRFPKLREADILGEIFVQNPNGTWLVGFFGMRHLAWQIPLGWLLLPIFYFPFMDRLGPKIYGWVAKRRYAINQALGYHCDENACKIDFSSHQK